METRYLVITFSIASQAEIRGSFSDVQSAIDFAKPLRDQNRHLAVHIVLIDRYGTSHREGWWNE